MFSRETVRSIDKLYVAFEDKPYLEEIVALGSSSRYLPDPWMETELWLRTHLPPWLRASLFSTRQFTLEVYEAIGYVLVTALAFGLYWLTAAW